VAPEAARPSDDVIAFLADLGASDAQIEDYGRTNNLHGLAADLILAARLDRTARDVAAAVGTTVEAVLETSRSLGIEVRDPDERRFGEDDVPMFASLLAMSPLGDEGGVLRVVGSSIGRIADAAISAFVQDVEVALAEQGLSPLERIQATADTAASANVIGRGLGPLLLHHLRQSIQRQRASQSDSLQREVARVAVGFVDLVGFTPLSRQLAPRALVDLVRRFERRSFDLAASFDGRVVKHIGDEIMFVTLDPAAGSRLALALVDELGEDVQPRGGLSCGDVLTRHGDYYGPVVNLASRLCDEAVPGEVLVDEAVVRVAASVEDLVFEPAGRRLPKGFDDPVRVWSLVRRW
jgi:adenylate cyclase